MYLPPGAELRGGAWVVLDSTINPDMMEMYADDNSRGSVLEPSGAVEIKYRDRDLIKTMHRLDDKLQALDAKLADKTQVKRSLLLFLPSLPLSLSLSSHYPLSNIHVGCRRYKG